MADSAAARRDSQKIRRPWCCSFGVLPKSPDNLAKLSSSPHSSFPSSPQIHHHRTTLARVSRMDPRRILSPGRVSPIDSDPPPVLPDTAAANQDDCNRGAQSQSLVVTDSILVQDEIKNDVVVGGAGGGVYDVRLSLRGKKGGSLVLELDSEVLSGSSSVFKDLIAECRKKEGGAVNFCRIEVPEVENLGVFHETIELMFEEDAGRRIRNMGVSRSIDVLEIGQETSTHRFMAMEICFQVSTISTPRAYAKLQTCKAQMKASTLSISSSSSLSTTTIDQRSRRSRSLFVCKARETVDEVLVVTDKDWKSLVISSETPVLVEFWAPWCGPCRMIAPVVDELAKQYAGKLACFKLNTDDCPTIATEYGIRSIPTVLFFKNGEKKESVIGAVPKSTLTATIEKYVEL